MELFKVYAKGRNETAIGIDITSSEATAQFLVAELVGNGQEAWYEQIQ